MKKPIKLAGACLIAVAALALASSSVVAGDEGWKDTAELGLVNTSGNSENTTFNFKNTLSREWDKSGFALKAGGVQVDSTTKTTTATATADNVFSVNESEVSAKTAEAYYLNGRYDRKITDTFFWFAGAGWDRNTFAGIDNRYIGEGGLANIWHDTDDMKFRTSYGLTFTKQEDVAKSTTVDDTFLGARFGWEYLNKLNENTTYENLLLLDLNADETDDWRGDMINSISVAMSSRLALKVGLRLMYDNLPSVQRITIDPGTPPFVLASPTTDVPLDELDTIFSASLVVSF